MNPEEEKPVRTVKCPACSGMGGFRCRIGGHWATCHTCYGAREIPAIEADARDDAAEARWEAERGK